MKILNLYAGIGGNRQLWPDTNEILSVENNQEIVNIYKSYFPNDKIIVADAHQYLIDHYKEYDFIWSSVPCQTHSRARMLASKGGRYDVMYPDLKIYEEVIFLQNFYEGKWVVENVTPYYEPLIKPSTDIDRHLFWSNFPILKKDFKTNDEKSIQTTVSNDSRFGFNISGLKLEHRKDQIIRNLVNPEIGLHILDCAKLAIDGKDVHQNFIDSIFK